MKKEDSPILNELGKDPGFKVPENYFDNFNKQMAAMLPDVEITPVDLKPTTWQRLRPFAYLAAMFAGVWCMMSVFNHFNGGDDRVGKVAEQLHNDIQNVDDFMMSGTVSDYDLMNYEDSVMMSNEEAVPAEK